MTALGGLPWARRRSRDMLSRQFHRGLRPSSNACQLWGVLADKQGIPMQKVVDGHGVWQVARDERLVGEQRGAELGAE